MYATLMLRADSYTLMYMCNAVHSERVIRTRGTWQEATMYRTLATYEDWLLFSNF